MGWLGLCRLFLAPGRVSRRYWGPPDRWSGRPTLMAAAAWRSAPATRQVQPIRPLLRDGSRSARLVASPGDRKSTRLNSSHPSISYAVFCLKKKKTTETHYDEPKTRKKNHIT